MRRSLTKEDRLLKPSEFKRVFAAPGRASVPGAKLVCCPNEKTNFRFGLSVSRRYGGAVERNRIKRQFREIVRLNKERIRAGFDFVVIPFPGPYSYGEREKQFFLLLQRAALEKKSSFTRP